MSVTATDAKNRFGQLLEQAQRKPVIIEKAGRRHSVLMSVEFFDRLMAERRAVPGELPEAELTDSGRRFYDTHKAWFDEQAADFARHGVWNEEFKTW